MPFNFLSRRSHSEKTASIFVVSGLPRSGTSLMMQLLQAGGIPILTDQVRSADEDNPKGYYEYERVKKLKEGDVAWLKDAEGKAVKIISSLLEYLPKEYHYKIFFMQRDMQEILASQKQMLIRRGEPTDKVSDENLATIFQTHLEKVQNWLAQQPNMEVLTINYGTLLLNPKQEITALAEFIDLPLNIQAMLEVPDKSLHRQRKGHP